MREHLHTPWSDVLGLVTFDPAQDEKGYRLPAQPETREICGSSA